MFLGSKLVKYFLESNLSIGTKSLKMCRLTSKGLLSTNNYGWRENLAIRAKLFKILKNWNNLNPIGDWLNKNMVYLGRQIQYTQCSYTVESYLAIITQEIEKYLLTQTCILSGKRPGNITYLFLKRPTDWSDLFLKQLFKFYLRELC